MAGTGGRSPGVPSVGSVERVAPRVGELARRALGRGRAVVRLAPATDPFPVALAAAERGNALVLCPTTALAHWLGDRLARAGVPVAAYPGDWALGAAGATVVGTRAAAWAPVGDLAAVVVVDEHDESHRQEQAPTWHARDVAVERARRAGVPCVLTSPCPSLEALRGGDVIVPGRAVERAGWPIVDVVDLRDQDPRTGLLSPPLVRLLRSDRRVVCVLNRTGRARLLACAGCRELARCESCDAAVAQPARPGDRLVCARCGEERPVVCLACGRARMRALRQGVTRVRDEIEALVGEPVAEVTGARPAGATGDGARPSGPAGRTDGRGDGRGPDGRRGSGVTAPVARVVVGTEAALHQVGRADVVVFLDLDQELLAPRYRAAEHALGLVARAARLVGSRERGGRVLLQTHLPDHEVVQAALLGDPGRVTDAEVERRELLRFPPVTAMAEVSGPAAPAFVAGLRTVLEGGAGPHAGPHAGLEGGAGPCAGDGTVPAHYGPDVPDWGDGTGGAGTGPGGALGIDDGSGVELLGPANGRWLVRAPDHTMLCDALAATERPGGRLRVAVDPPRT